MEFRLNQEARTILQYIWHLTFLILAHPEQTLTSRIEQTAPLVRNPATAGPLAPQSSSSRTIELIKIEVEFDDDWNDISIYLDAWFTYTSLLVIQIFYFFKSILNTKRGLISPFQTSSKEQEYRVSISPAELQFSEMDIKWIGYISVKNKSLTKSSLFIMQAMTDNPPPISRMTLRMMWPPPRWSLSTPPTLSSSTPRKRIPWGSGARWMMATRTLLR